MAMTAHDPNLSRRPGGLLRWLGFGHKQCAPGEHEAALELGATQQAGSLTWRDRRRRQLLADITSFMLTHRLEVSPNALNIAWQVISGTNSKLTRLVEERIEAKEPITIEWLEDAARRSNPDNDEALLDALMARLETSIDEFSQTTSAARSATSRYNNALETQMDELRQVSHAGVVITELAAIARVMLDRTREIEAEMTRSEQETAALRASLEAARREAEMDHLTGLPNRRAFEAALKHEYEEAARNGEPLCVAICDLDHFKRINDTHGHDAGDRVLRSAAKSLAAISGDRCFVARHGGEEFVVLFRGKSIDEAWKVLDAAREKMAARRLVNRANERPFGQITFSAGIADVMHYDCPRAALRAADEALYVAKNGGRNRVVRADQAENRQAA
ncbi:MAG: GGDEF domain-containing protein [Novosphingobium sp.]|nr:GGDEF domain-containing protein [Novosphingobium sp.]